MKRQSILAFCVMLVILVPLAAQAPCASGVPPIPLCEGLTIVTAVNNGTADFESIKRITHIDASSVKLTYSAETPRSDNQMQRVELTARSDAVTSRRRMTTSGTSGVVLPGSPREALLSAFQPACSRISTQKGGPNCECPEVGPGCCLVC